MTIMYLYLFSLLTLFLGEPKDLVQINSNLQTTPAVKPDIAQDCIDSRLGAGKCVALDNCPRMVEEYYDEVRKTSYGVDFQTFVSNSICGFDGSNFLICCRGGVGSPLSNPQIAQYQNAPMIFVTPTSTSSSATTSPGVFLFAPLSGYSPTQSPVPVPSNPPTNYWPGSGGNIGYPNNPNSNPIIFQPTGQTSLTTSPPTVFQPAPVTTAPGLISQPTPNPIGPPLAPPTGGFDQTCGISRGTTNRVVGGVEAKRGTYPWIAALGYRDEFVATAVKFLCGASLISSTYVITSAHCINENLLLVRLGAHDISNPAEPNARDYRIKRSVVHSAFDLKSISNDIALIELTEVVVMTNFISPICLPEAPIFLTQEFVGMNPFVAGWGAAKHQGVTSKVLMDAQVPIVSRQSCEQSYRTIFNFVQFSDKLICAGNTNVDACQGDSGGPLMLPQPDSGTYRYYLIGIVSYGYECARSGFPGVYTRVASYMPWVKQNMI